MKIFILMFYLFCSYQTFSQTNIKYEEWEFLYNKSYTFLNNHLVDSSIHYGTEAYVIAEGLFDVKDWELYQTQFVLSQSYANIEENDIALEYAFMALKNVKKCCVESGNVDNLYLLDLIAVLYEKLNQKEKSILYYQKAVDETKEKLGFLNKEYYLRVENQYISLYDFGNFNEAISIATELNDILKDDIKNNEEFYIFSFTFIAVCYEKLGDYNKAIEYSIKAKEATKYILGEDHPSYILRLNDITQIYKDIGNYLKAKDYADESVALAKEKYGDTHEKYADNINILANILIALGEYKKALELYVEAAEITKNNFGEKQPTYSTRLNNLAQIYSYLGNYKKALEYSLKSNEIFKNTLGVKHPDYDIQLNNLAHSYSHLGNYKKALELKLQALEITKNTLGVKHPYYSLRLSNLALEYSNIGNYKKALELQFQAVEITKNTLGEKHPEYALSLSNLASTYSDLGNYKKALELQLRAVEITKNTLGEKHPTYALRINNISLTYKNLGDNKKAFELSLNALEITKNNLGLNHPDYSNRLNSLSLIYSNLGNHKKALELELEATEIIKNTLGVNDQLYAQKLGNLSVLYKEIGNYEKALEYSLRSCEITKNNLGKNHHTYALLLNNQALIYYELKDYKKAFKVSTIATKITKSIYGKKNIEYSNKINTLAMIYGKLENYNKSLNLFYKSKEIIKKELGIKHPLYSLSLGNIATCYKYMNDFGNTFLNFKESNSIFLNEIENNYGILTSKEKEIFNFSRTKEKNRFHNFSMLASKQIPEIIEEDFNLVLASSSLLLNNNIDIREVLKTQNDSSLNNLFTDLNIVKKQIDFTYSLSIEERKNRSLNIDTLLSESSKLERELVQKTSSFIDYPDYTLGKNDIVKDLSRNEAAIQFNSFRFHNGKEWTESTFYVAYILKENGALEYIPLFEEEELKPLIDNLNENKGDTKELFRQLYKLVWKPLEDYLKGVEKIYYAPSGLLHKVAFNALVKDDSSYLSSSYDLHTLLSVRDIPELKKDKTNKSNDLIALIGGANFEAKTNEEIDESSTDFLMNQSLGSLLRNMNNRSGWSYLKGSLEEVNQINDIALNSKQTTILKTGVEANEENFNAIIKNQKPKIIHLATHGYYLPAPKEKLKPDLMRMDDNSFANSDEPLLRSGVLLSGANQKWVNNNDVDSDIDGVLTALEVSRLDLSKTELIVLSACETGLGDIVRSEGVYGLQRAFKMAGVQNQLVSLWEVPDKETSEMMTLFYTALLEEKLSYFEAFNKAQKIMRDKYPEEPLKWAGFVFIQ